MTAVLSVARTAFRESFRNRTMLAILVLALGFIASALILAAMSLDQRERVLLDWGLFCVSFFGIVLAIVIGVSQVEREVRRKNLYVVLSRPIHRAEYAVGKYLGLAATLTTEFLVLALALLILLLTEGMAVGLPLFQALFAALLEILLVAALAVFFASFSSPYLSGFFTLGLFVVGRSLPMLDKLAQKVPPGPLHGFLKGLVWGLPNLADYTLATRVVHGLPIAWAEIGWLSLYGLGYTALLLVLSAWIWSRRDLV